jgi:hypothetical protein
MATTTNYGWTTPDDTDLVKDGAAAIRTLGSSADTTVKNLSPGTTAGDVDYYTSGTAKARLGIGTAGQVLTVNTGATAPEWVTPITGGMTLISTTTLTGSSVTLSSIPQTYKNLQLVLRDFYPSTSAVSVGIRINADSGSNYQVVKIRTSSSSNANATGQTIISLNDNITESGNADTNNSAVFNFYDYTETLRQNFEGLFVYNTTGAVAVATKINGSYIPSTSAAITSLVIAPSSGNFGGGTALLYGVK